MRILFTADGSDPMLMDTLSGLHALHADLEKFLKSHEPFADFPAAMDRNPAPYQEFLRGLRLIRGAGEPRLTLGPDRWLVLTGATEKLEECAKQFLAEEENGHTHLYTAPMSLIIESDSTWRPDVAA